MVLEPESPLPRWSVIAASALAVGAIGIGAGLLTGSDDSSSEPGLAGAPSAPPITSPSTAPSSSSDPTSPTRPPGETLPVTLQAPGWACDPAADEKFTCSAGEVVVLVTVRPADSHDDYLHDPDKASPDQYVSAVHDGLFATINRMPGDTTTDVAVLGQALVWQ